MEHQDGVERRRGYEILLLESLEGGVVFDGDLIAQVFLTPLESITQKNFLQETFLISDEPLKTILRCIVHTKQ